MPAPGRGRSRAETRHTKAATRGERYGGLDVTLTCANAGTGQWRWRESNLAGCSGTCWLTALTCGNVQDVFGPDGSDCAGVLTASTITSARGGAPSARSWLPSVSRRGGEGGSRLVGGGSGM